MEGSCKYIYHAVANSWRRSVNALVNSSGPSTRNCRRRWRDEPLVDGVFGPVTWHLIWKVPSDTTTSQWSATECPARSSLSPRLHWSQKRHNTAKQHSSRETSPDTCGYSISDMSVQTYSYCSYTITEPIGLFALSLHCSNTLWKNCYV